MRVALLALAVTLMMSLVLGRVAMICSLLFCAWAELAALWHEGQGRVGAVWTAWARVGLPWLLGALVVESPLTTALVSALVLTLLFALHLQPSLIALLGPLVAAGYLILLGRAFAAGMVLLLAFPGLRLVLHRPSVDAYRRAVFPWLLAMLMIIAGSL
jgi:hypothetical protein